MTCLGVALDEATVRPGPDSVVRLELWYSLANFNTVPIDVSPNAFLDRAEESRRAATLLGPDERKALWADCNEDMRRVGETARSREKP